MDTIYLQKYLLDPAVWTVWGGRLLKALLIVVLARLLLAAGVRLAERALDRAGHRGVLTMDNRRARTLVPLVRSLLRYVVDVVAVLSLLSIFLPPETLQPILASAGVVGLAVGFGAQSLVKDIIAGFFILYEDQFAVGDYITTGTYSGVAEDIGLRITRLRDFSGAVHVLPNGVIEAVSNMSRGRMRAMVDVSVAYEEDLPHVLEVLRQVSADIAREFGETVEAGPEVLGVVNFGPSAMDIRIQAQTRPMEQWGVERALRHRILEAFEREGIEIAYPKQVFLQGRDRPRPAADPGTSAAATAGDGSRQ
ncbi:MAG: mechanosensitive ion channel family protein [Bacillota bacterium]